MDSETTSAGITGRTSLQVEPGETVLLSPDTSRFRYLYRQVRPRSIEEVRTHLGLSKEATKIVKQRPCCQPTTVPPVLVTPEDLESKDPATRFRARSAAYQVASTYVRSPEPAHLSHWTSTLNRFLDITKSVIHFVELYDIDVANGGTLIISANTQAVYAHDVRIHGNGRIVCKGSVTFHINSLEGRIPSATVNPSVLTRA
jgi:hypothetical protein